MAFSGLFAPPGMGDAEPEESRWRLDRIKPRCAGGIRVGHVQQGEAQNQLRHQVKTDHQGRIILNVSIGYNLLRFALAKQFSRHINETKQPRNGTERGHWQRLRRLFF
jgi:hypothetical protein